MDKTETLVMQFRQSVRVYTTARIYLYLRDQKLPVTQLELARLIGVSKARLNKVITELESKKTTEQ
jgi:predicted transcriptional regulator